MNFKVFEKLGLRTTGSSTIEEQVALGGLQAATKAVTVTGRAAVRGLSPVVSCVYDAVATRADLVVTGGFVARTAANCFVSPALMTAVDLATSLTSVGAIMHSGHLGTTPGGNELRRAGMVGMAVSLVSFATGVCAAMNGSPHSAIILSTLANALGICFELGAMKHDSWTRQLERQPSDVYTADALKQAVITVKKPTFGASFVTITDTRPFGEGAFGNLCIGKNRNEQNYRTASVKANADEIAYIRDTAKPLIEHFADEPERQAQFQAVVDHCNAALERLEPAPAQAA